jgi:adenylate cyclase
LGLIFFLIQTSSCNVFPIAFGAPQKEDDMAMHQAHAKTLAMYAAAAGLLSFYGAQVCPFLESLSAAAIFFTLALIFAFGFVLRFAAFRFVERSRFSIGRSPWRLLLLDLSIWIFTGVAATAWNNFYYGFPFESGLKILVGSLTMGILASTYNALQSEERLIQLCQSGAESFRQERSHFISLSTKFLVFVTAALALFSIVIMLLVFKDLDYVRVHPNMARAQMLREVSFEISFVLVFLLGACLGIARQYARNLRMMFDLIQNAFEEVEMGVFTTRVPIVSNDELSRIAQHTNQMIVGLRDRERIKMIFGKYVSPAIADAIMKSERGSELGGREVRVAILFTDIRNYTALSEKLSPSEVVEFLNFYFTKVVDAVHGAGGVLDKFIGDAAMAVFGVSGSATAASDAVKAAFAIRGILAQVNSHLRERGHPVIDNGIGIHYGSVIAGNIGSAQRLEYTVIGDAVNTASRIEGLCKTQPFKILISAHTYENISAELRQQFSSLGEFQLKGKSKPTAIYGAGL